MLIALTPGEKLFDKMEVVSVEAKTGHTAAIAKGSIHDKEITIDLGLNNKAPEGAEFLPSCVRIGKKPIWQFSDEKFKGLAKLREHKGDLMIVLGKIEKERSFCVHRILPFRDLLAPKQKYLIGNEIKVFGGMTASALLDLKIDFCRTNSCFWELSDEEHVIVGDRQKLKTEAELAEKKRKTEESEARRQAILSRKTITVYTEDGKTVFGIPCTEAEWHSLPEGKGVILVASYENGRHGDLISAFFVDSHRKNGKTKRIEKSPIFATDPTVMKALGIAEVRVTQDREIIPVFSKVSDLNKIAASGINSGTLAGVHIKDTTDKVAVYSLKKGKAVRLGEFSAQLHLAA